MTIRLLAVLALMGLVSAAQAATTSSTMDVLARFSETCIASAPPLNFGVIKRQSMQQNVIITGRIDIICSANVIYRIGLDAGQHYDASTPENRRMVGPNGAYSLYTVLQPTTGSGGPIWGDNGLGNTLTAGEPFVRTGTGDQVPVSYTFTAVAFGVVFGNGDANGDYSDTLTMTVDY